MSDNDRLRIVVLEGSVLELLAINDELVAVMEEAIAYGDWPLWSERARAVIAKANRHGFSPTVPPTSPGRSGERP